MCNVIGEGRGEGGKAESEKVRRCDGMTGTS